MADKLGTVGAAFLWTCIAAIVASVTFAICYTIIERVL